LVEPGKIGVGGPGVIQLGEAHLQKPLHLSQHVLVFGMPGQVVNLAGVFAQVIEFVGRALREA